MQFVVFDTGDFLIGGRVIEKHRLTKPFIAIFNGRGQLQKYVSPKQELTTDSREIAEAAAANPTESDYDLAVESTFAEKGNDGNVYLVRNTPKGPVFVISPAGVVLRTLHLLPPSKKGQLVAVKLAGGRIAAQFEESDPRTAETAAVTISVTDSNNGKELSRYFHKDPEIGVGLACFEAPDEFTFVGADEEGRLRIVRAAPR